MDFITFLSHKDCIRTFTGKMVNPLQMSIDDIDINDIAHALSHISRFGGHTQNFLSVAQHSLYVCTHLSIQHKLAGLLHDAAEAYLLDLPTPVKKQSPAYAEAENKLIQLIAKKYGFQYPFHPEIKDIDAMALEYEYKFYHQSDTTTPSPKQVKQQFLQQFHLLTQNKWN